MSKGQLDDRIASLSVQIEIEHWSGSMIMNGPLGDWCRKYARSLRKRRAALVSEKARRDKQ